MKKHLVYAEDILRKLMEYPDNAIYKHTIRQLFDEAVKAHEVTCYLVPSACCCEDEDGDFCD